MLEPIKKIYLNIAKPKSSNGLREFKESIEEASSKIDLFIAPSSFVKNKFIAHGFLESKILYSPNGIDYSGSLYPAKNKSEVLRFAYIGILLPMKGLNVLISAFKEVKYKNIELSIYGKLFSYVGFESYPNLFRKMISSDSRIKYKGGYDNKDIGKILANIDMLVVPSVWPENAPLVIQEAFLFKTPVIASRIGGIPELVTDTVNGLLFNPGDVNDLKGKIQYVIDNPEVIERFKENIPGVKSIEDNASEVEDIYNKLILQSQ